MNSKLNFAMLVAIFAMELVNHGREISLYGKSMIVIGMVYSICAGIYEEFFQDMLTKSNGGIQNKNNGLPKRTQKARRK